jgi:hypothetical protein
LSGTLGFFDAENFHECFAGNDNSAVESIDVLVAPWVFESKTKTKARRPVFWLPAILNKNYDLVPRTDAFPIFSHHCLQPNEQDDFAVVEPDALVAATRSVAVNISGWSDLIGIAERLFEKLTGSQISRWCPTDYTQIPTSVVLIDTPRPNDITRTLQELCKAFCQSPGMLHTALANGVEVRDTLPRALRLSGQGINLNEKQSLAARASVNMNEGNILAIHGPPGTGKTAVLSSIIGERLLDNHLVDIEKPSPVFLASHSNQAALNAANAINRVKPPGGGRWVRTLDSECLVFDGVQLDALSYLNSFKFRDVIRRVFNPDFGYEEADYWTSRLNEFFGHTSFTLPSGLQQLKSFIQRQVDSLNDVTAARDFLVNSGGWMQISIDYEILKTARSVRDQLISKLANAKANLRVHEKKWEESAANLQFLDAIVSAADGGRTRLINLFKSKSSTEQQKVNSVLDSIAHWGDVVPDLARHMSLKNLVAAVRKNLTIRVEIAESQIGKITGYISGIENDLRLRNRLIDDKERSVVNLDRAKRCIYDAVPEVVMNPVSFDRDMEIVSEFTSRTWDSVSWLCKRYREGVFIDHAVNGLHETIHDSVEKDHFLGRNAVQMRNELHLLFPVVCGTLFQFAKEYSPVIGGSPSKEVLPMRDYASLIVIEEAGQASPFSVLPMIGLGRRLVVVGDTQQLPPIDTIQDGARQGLARRHLGTLAFDLEEEGFLDQQSSILHWMQQYTCYSDHGKFPGISLNEHFRCRASIIDFSNKLSYQRKLISRKDDLPFPPLPHLGYGNIKGSARRPSDSTTGWVNEAEALSIIEWIRRHKNSLVSAYGCKRIEEVVAVITPYAAQKKEIEVNLPDELKPIVVGTVHALQGSEFPVVIYSPTKTASQADTSFDQMRYMLNVAVSRAKESFIVIGDMNFLSARNPGSNLGRLYKSIVDYSPEPIPGFSPSFGKTVAIRRIDTRASHFSELEKALQRAQKRVLISSYKCRRWEEGNPPVYRWIAETLKRGVEVNLQVGTRSKDDEEQAKEATKSLNCYPNFSLTLNNRLHRKTVLVDDNTLFEGSFNWLGWFNDRNPLIDTTTIIEGERAREHVKAVWDRFASLQEKLH